jgi:uncharacterized membrane protein (UPF0127 family)
MSIIIPVREARSFVEKSFGLLFYKNPVPMLFRTRFGIHTFGMRFPIDVIVVKKNGIVASQKKNLLPNRIFVWNPRFSTVIELPQGYIEEHVIRTGSKVEILRD